VETLREWIATHDAVLQPTTGQTFDSVDDLFDAMLAGS
jgi:protein-disulfide isomerase-like protein with CxxC motif